MISIHKTIILLLTAPLFLISCAKQAKQKQSLVIEVLGEKDLIPEGIAVDPATQLVYLSSIHHKKIVRVNSETGFTEDFWDTGYKSGVGMLVQSGKLFAIGSDVEAGPKSSVLLVLDLITGSEESRFSIRDTTDHFWNDLALAKNGLVYITDTEAHSIYRIRYPDGEPEPWVYGEDKVMYPNGIALSEDNTLLYVATWDQGIRVIDPQTAAILNPPDSLTSEIGIDGMKYYKGNLYGIQNGFLEKEKHGLVKIKLSEDGKAVTGIDYLLMNHPLMDVPTTLSIANDTIYLIANSQLESLDQELNQVISPEGLSNTFILKYPLNQQ